MWDPATTVDIHTVLTGDAEMWEGFGVVGDATKQFAGRWDPRDDYVSVDCGDVGEDAQGVWITRHPEVLLADRPEIWDTLTMWRATSTHDLTIDHVRGMSAYEHTVWAILTAASHRQEIRQIKDRDDG